MYAMSHLTADAISLVHVSHEMPDVRNTMSHLNAAGCRKREAEGGRGRLRLM